MLLNARKSERSFFTPSTQEARWQPTVALGETPLHFNPKLIFLGVMLDRSLSFSHQVDQVAAAVGARCKLLGAIGERDWGQTRSGLRRTFQSFIRSSMDYCGAAWRPFLSQSDLDKLERCQNRALRLVTGQLATTPVECLRLEAGF